MTLKQSENFNYKFAKYSLDKLRKKELNEAARTLDIKLKNLDLGELNLSEYN